jgi:site-specific recombinase XerD
MKKLPVVPDATRRFLRTGVHRRRRLLVYAFHRWLDRRQLALAELTPTDLQRFLARPNGVLVARQIRIQYGQLLRPYLQWSYDRGLVSFVPAPRRRRPLELPNLANAFIASLVPTHRPETLHRYVYSLRKLYGWLNVHGLAPERLTRAALAPWFQSLHTSGLHVTTRFAILIDARAYLHWVREQRRMQTAPDELIRKTDIPKLPQYLPRPLTAEADRALQRRLADADDPGAWALRLMRHTGLRIGELRSLAYHCIRADHQRVMLKVPLGKLNNERLVPLDASSVALIRQLQRTAPHPRAWLVPSVGGARISYDRLRRLLTKLSRDLPDPIRITSHRLRHTYATELLNAGMSLPGVMRLLGHRDIKMTMRYAAVTSHTVSDEYAKALTQIASKYQLPARSPTDPTNPDPEELLAHLERWLRKHISPHRQLKALIQRIERVRCEVQKLRTPSKPSP